MVEKPEVKPSRECPQCQSENVKTASPLFFILGAVAIPLGVVLMIIPALGILLLAAGVALISYAAYTRSTVRCESCKHSWRPSRE